MHVHTCVCVRVCECERYSVSFLSTHLLFTDVLNNDLTLVTYIAPTDTAAILPQPHTHKLSVS